MQKPCPIHFLLRLWTAASLLLAGLIMLSTVAEQDDIFQPWDFNNARFEEIHRVIILRSLINLTITTIFTAITFLRLQNILPDFKLKQIVSILPITTTGMLLGLTCFYTSFCCMSPPTFYLGFPFAWLSGSAIGESIIILKSETGYLIQNFFHLPWII